jgi:hypothetical protein
VLAALLVVGAAVLAWAVLSYGRHFDAFGRQEGLTNVVGGPGPGGTVSSSSGVGPSGTATAGGPGGGGAGSGGNGSNDGSGSGTGNGSGSGSGSSGNGSGGSSPGSGGGSGGGGSTGPIGAGDYTVGTDIAVGAWTTAGPLLTLNVCSYSVNGHPAIQITVSAVATTIHLSAGDTFVTQGCQDWRHTG